METATKPVTLTKMCKLHGIDLPREGSLAQQFQAKFPDASFDAAANEWRLVWEKGHFAESNARLEAFFASQGVGVIHIDRC
jgi:hypothetical protein